MAIAAGVLSVVSVFPMPQWVDLATAILSVLWLVWAGADLQRGTAAG